MRRVAAVVPLLLLSLTLAACGGGGDPAQEESPTPTAEPSEKDVPEALSELQCLPAEDGSWSAAGTVSNDGEEAADFTVRVYVGPVDGVERPAGETVLEAVQPGGSAHLDLTGIPPHGEPAVCHVQVLRDPPK